MIEALRKARIVISDKHGLRFAHDTVLQGWKRLKDQIDEERRLAYVGITRAQDHLVISRAASRIKWGKRRTTLPSRFLLEMRNEDLKAFEAVVPGTT